MRDYPNRDHDGGGQSYSMPPAQAARQDRIQPPSPNDQTVEHRRIAENDIITGTGKPTGNRLSALETRGVRELRSRARQMNLPGRSKMNKEQLIEALRHQMQNES